NLAAAVQFLARAYGRSPDEQAQEMLVENAALALQGCVCDDPKHWRNWLAPSEPEEVPETVPEAVPSESEDEDVEALTIRLPGNLVRAMRGFAPEHGTTVEAWAAEGAASIGAVWIEQYSQDLNDEAVKSAARELNTPEQGGAQR